MIIGIPAFDAYPNNEYNEEANDYAASLGGYSLYNRTITLAQYLEYDNLVTN